jgi:hypothetical protein
MAKLTFLLPRWHGSKEDCLTFARETLDLAETSIGMADLAEVIQTAHLTMAKRRSSSNPSSYNEYWENPEVWADLVRSYRILSHPGQMNRKLIDSRFFAQTILCRQRTLTIEESTKKYDLSILRRYRVDVTEEIQKKEIPTNKDGEEIK